MVRKHIKKFIVIGLMIAIPSISHAEDAPYSVPEYNDDIDYSKCICVEGVGIACESPAKKKYVIVWTNYDEQTCAFLISLGTLGQSVTEQFSSTARDITQ